MPDLDPDTLARIAKTVSDLYGDAVARMLGDVAKRMAAGIDEPGWAERKLLDLVRLRADAEAVVAELQRTAGPAVRKAIKESHTLGSKAAASELKLSGEMVPRTNSAAVEALARETITKLQGTHGGILRAADDVFRQVTAEVGAAGVVTGSESRRQAAQRALDRYADHGISGFTSRRKDGTTVNWEIETYAEMTTRTSSGRAMIDGRLEVYVADGREFVIVSDSPQECKLCRPFEGKGLSISGNGVGTTVGGIRIVDTIDGARAAGLQHPNCRHDLRPIVPGLTEKPKGTEDPDGDAARQEQRRLERGVRQWKRREAVAIDDQARAMANAKVRQWQGRLDQHTSQTGLRRKPDRERVRLGGVTPTPTTSGVRSRIPRDSPQGRKVTRALDAAQKAHDLPDQVKGVTFFDGSGLPSSTRGFYNPRGGTIALNSGSGIEGTAVHELGHAIEHRAFGGIGKAMQDPRLRSAVEGTAEVQQLRALASSGKLNPRAANHVAYLLDPAEVWARAYTQWVARKSEAPTVRKTITHAQNLAPSNPGRYRQWSNQEFDPIATVMDALFREKGLR